MTFWCFPPDSKCEWDDLRSFVEQYNRTYGKSYYRSACLDVESRNASEPELLLEAPNECPIVIERKSVVWPPEHFAGHRNEHDLLHTFVEALCSRSDPFSDDVYQLVVNAISLAGRSKRDVHGVATRIADVVLAHQGEARSSGGIARAEPIPWRFRPVPSCERDESVPTRGIGIVGKIDIDLAEMVREVGRAKSGYAQEFQRSAMAAAKKFKKYGDCQKFLLVQFCGPTPLKDEDIAAIVQSAQLPEPIDQVWFARHDWIDEWDYDIAWGRAR